MMGSHEREYGLRRAAVYASMSVAIFLVLGKLAAWWYSGSVAMLGSLADSGLDFVASLLTFIAVRTAFAPPDHDHRFGHGKAEALGALCQAAMMAISIIFLLIESVQRIHAPMPVSDPSIARDVSLLAIVVTTALVIFQGWVVRQTGSLAVRADSVHYRGDLFLNLSVLLAMVLIEAGGPVWTDGAFGVVVAAYIGFHGYQVARPAVDVLMDKEFTVAERERIFNLVMGNCDVRGLHDLKTRNAGTRRFIQMHVEMDGKLSLHRAHMIATEIEATVGEAFENAEILVHMDPVGLEVSGLTHGELDLGSHQR